MIAPITLMSGLRMRKGVSVVAETLSEVYLHAEALQECRL